MPAIGHAPGFRSARAVLTVGEAERVLSDWFGAEVVLTSSGRAAILLYLRALGLNRYRDRVALPRFISSCVLDAVIRCGFPIDAASGGAGDVSILYHQFGIPQRSAPSGVVIEDNCHAFFATPSTGGRDWKGEVAVFSVPKFFGLDGMIGGLVLVNETHSKRLREMLGAASEIAKTGRMRGPSETGLDTNPDDMETMYLRRLLNPQLLDEETGGLPNSIDEIRSVGLARQRNLQRLADAAGKKSFPPGWTDMLCESVPFALPVFLETEALKRTNARLCEIGINAGEYQIDVNRDMTEPRHEKAVLVPCHHEIPAPKLDQMAAILASASA